MQDEQGDSLYLILGEEMSTGQYEKGIIRQKLVRCVELCRQKLNTNAHYEAVERCTVTRCIA